ncbi:hypothetical protein GC176_09055 [bacterium]|nr:hypothetical protein [bacterium]
MDTKQLQNVAGTLVPDEFAQTYFSAYLAENRENAAMLREMAETIDHFRSEAPEILLRKCMDGRTNTTDHKGCPPTTVDNQRSDGNKAIVDPNNTDFWLPIRVKMIRAACRTPGKPAMFITAAHRSKLSGSCAAYAKQNDRKDNTDRRALQGVIDQALDVENALYGTPDADRLFCLAAMTNTDTGAMELHLPSGEGLFNAEELMGKNRWMAPAQVFARQFLDQPINDPDAHESVQGRTTRSLLSGPPAEALTNPRVKIALEAYLLKQFNLVCSNGGDLTSLVSPAAAEAINEALRRADKLPHCLAGFIAYLIAWNVAFALEQTHQLLLLEEDPDALDHRVGHDERLIGYGNGFEAATKHNNMLLVKPGSGNDRQAISVAKHVVDTVAERRQLPRHPLVHVNIELDTPIATWQQFTTVLARMNTKMAVIRSVFGADSNVRVMTTYSYAHIARDMTIYKQFFPLNPNPADRLIVCPQNLCDIVSPKEFSSTRMRELEEAYTRQASGAVESGTDHFSNDAEADHADEPANDGKHSSSGRKGRNSAGK